MKAKLVEGGPDHGTPWIELAIPPSAKPEEVADGLRDSFDDEWIRALIEKLTERVK